MTEAPNRHVDVLVSGLIIAAAARLLRIAFLHGTVLQSFTFTSVLPVLALYLLAFVLFVAAFYALGTTKPPWMETLWNRLSRHQHIVARIVRYGALTGLVIIIGKAVASRIELRTFGTDGVLFSQFATDLVLEGRNPYAHSMAEAYARYHVSQDWATFRIDGSLVTAFSYPAMSVLTYLPQAALHIPNLDLTTLVLLFVSFALIIWSSPWSAAWIPLLLLSANSDIINFSGGGVFDAIWLLPMLLAMYAAARHQIFFSGLLFGWACSAKQTPWLAAPFLVVFFVMERKRVADGVRFAAAAALAFLVINGPFIAANPAAWLAGSLTPVAGGAPLVEHGTGPILLNLAGLTALPKVFFGALGAIVLICSVVGYASNYTRLRWLAWSAPIFALWCNYRSLQNYFVFSIPLAYLGVLLQLREAPVERRTFGPIASACAFASAIAVVALGFSLRHATALAGAINLVGAEDANALGASARLTVDVRNDESHALDPVFSVLHKTRVAPMIWRVIEGPSTIAAHQTERFVIEAPDGFNGLIPFDSGLHLRVYDRGTEKRLSSVIEALSSFDPNPLEHRVANPRFVNWIQHPDRRVPYAWRDASLRWNKDVRVNVDEIEDGVTLRVNNLPTRARKALALAGLEQPLVTMVNAITVDASTTSLTPCAATDQSLPEIAFGFELRIKSGERIRIFFSSCTTTQVGGTEDDVHIFIAAQANTRGTYDVDFMELVTPELRSHFLSAKHPLVVVFAGVRPGEESHEASVTIHSIRGR